MSGRKSTNRKIAPTLKNSYYDSEEFKGILSAYETSVAEGRTPYFDADDFADMADYYLNIDKPKKCFQCLDRGLALHPEDHQLLSIKSGAYIYTHKYRKAEKIIANLNPDEEDVLYQRAQLEYALYHNPVKAEEMFTEWIDMQSEAADDFSDEDDAQQHEELLRDAYIHVITSFIELSKHHDYDDELVKRWVEDYLVMFSPLGNYDSDLILADTVREEGLYDMVVKVYTSILETNPYLKYGWTVLAAAQYTCEMYEDALESAEFALAVNPKDWDSLLTKAHCFYSTYRHDEALPCFEEYIEHTADTSQHLPYAICLIHAERNAEALEQLKKAEAYYQEHEPDRESYAACCFEMSEAYLALERISESERFVDKSMDLCPEENYYRLQKGTLRLAYGDVQTAMIYFASYIENESDIVDGLVQVVGRLLLFGLVTVVVELIGGMEKFGRRNPRVKELYPYKALAYLRMGSYKDFLIYLKKSQRLCPEHARNVLSFLFPEGMEPKDYYQYMTNNLSKIVEKKSFLA